MDITKNALTKCHQVVFRVELTEQTSLSLDVQLGVDSVVSSIQKTAVDGEHTQLGVQ